jgi:hypothetical protein
MAKRERAILLTRTRYQGGRGTTVARYRVGDRLRHTNGGGRWEVLAQDGTDYLLKCIEAGPGSHLGREDTMHLEYMERSFVIESGPDRLCSIVIHQNAETGEEIDRRELGPEDDYIVVLGPEFAVSYIQEYANGTTQLTIKRAATNAQ